MTTLRTAVVACALLGPGLASAAAAQPAQPQLGACMLALQAPPAQPAPGAAAKPPEQQPQPRKKININFLFDPCSMSNAERDNEQTDKPALSRDQLLQEYESWMEWNRQHGGGRAQQEVWWFSTLQELPRPQEPGAVQPTAWVPGGLGELPLVARAGGQPWLDQAEPLPAVPEPSRWALLLAGLACLIVSARRRLQRR